MSSYPKRSYSRRASFAVMSTGSRYTPSVNACRCLNISIGIREQLHSSWTALQQQQLESVFMNSNVDTHSGHSPHTHTTLSLSPFPANEITIGSLEHKSIEQQSLCAVRTINAPTPHPSTSTDSSDSDNAPLSFLLFRCTNCHTDCFALDCTYGTVVLYNRLLCGVEELKRVRECDPSYSSIYNICIRVQNQSERDELSTNTIAKIIAEPALADLRSKMEAYMAQQRIATETRISQFIASEMEKLRQMEVSAKKDLVCIHEQAMQLENVYTHGSSNSAANSRTASPKEKDTTGSEFFPVTALNSATLNNIPLSTFTARHGRSSPRLQRMILSGIKTANITTTTTGNSGSLHTSPSSASRNLQDNAPLRIEADVHDSGAVIAEPQPVLPKPTNVLDVLHATSATTAAALTATSASSTSSNTHGEYAPVTDSNSAVHTTTAVPSTLASNKSSSLTKSSMSVFSSNPPHLSLDASSGSTARIRMNSSDGAMGSDDDIRTVEQPGVFRFEEDLTDADPETQNDTDQEYLLSSPEPTPRVVGRSSFSQQLAHGQQQQAGHVGLGVIEAASDEDASFDSLSDEEVAQHATADVTAGMQGMNIRGNPAMNRLPQQESRFRFPSSLPIAIPAQLRSLADSAANTITNANNTTSSNATTAAAHRSSVTSTSSLKKPTYASFQSQTAHATENDDDDADSGKRRRKHAPLGRLSVDRRTPSFGGTRHSVEQSTHDQKSDDEDAVIIPPHTMVQEPYFSFAKVKYVPKKEVSSVMRVTHNVPTFLASSSETSPSSHTVDAFLTTASTSGGSGSMSNFSGAASPFHLNSSPSDTTSSLSSSLPSRFAGSLGAAAKTAKLQAQAAAVMQQTNTAAAKPDPTRVNAVKL